jgi:hypothetical protein
MVRSLIFRHVSGCTFGGICFSMYRHMPRQLSHKCHGAREGHAVERVLNLCLRFGIIIIDNLLRHILHTAPPIKPSTP